MSKMQEMCSEGFHRLADRRCCVEILWNLSEGNSTKLCVIYRIKNNSAVFQTVATACIAPKICQGQPPTMYSEYSRFHPNPFTFRV